MSLGFDAISALPFATSGPDSDVLVSTTGNALTITIGSVGIIADSVVQDPDPNQVTLGLGTLTISGDSNFTVTGNATSLGLGSFTVTADASVSPTGNALTLATGNVTITGTALVNPTGSGLTLNTNEAGVITWNEIVPGANMVWTPIDPS
jgi:hypothetical protein